LNNFVQQVYNTHPHIKFFGSCFGHQIICQALLGPHGAIVTKDLEGWEIGVHPVVLTPSFLAYTKKEWISNLRDNLRFQFIHADHVIIPPEVLPSGWMVVGSSRHCAVQGVLEPGRVLTYQGHFEFDRFINSETLKVFGALWDGTRISTALESIDADDDAEIAAMIVASFFVGGACSAKNSNIATGLLTPPDEEACL